MDTTTSTVADLFEDAAAANTQAAQAMCAVGAAQNRLDAVVAEAEAGPEIQAFAGRRLSSARTAVYEAQVAASEAVNNARTASTRALTAAFNNGV